MSDYNLEGMDRRFADIKNQQVVARPAFWYGHAKLGDQTSHPKM